MLAFPTVNVALCIRNKEGLHFSGSVHEDPAIAFLLHDFLDMILSQRDWCVCGEPVLEIP